MMAYAGGRQDGSEKASLPSPSSSPASGEEKCGKTKPREERTTGGRDDVSHWRVPVGEAEQIVAALRARNVPVAYLRYDDECHGLSKLANRLDAYTKMVDFLDEVL
jgi:acetyl esterase/lipase